MAQREHLPCIGHGPLVREGLHHQPARQSGVRSPDRGWADFGEATGYKLLRRVAHLRRMTASRAPWSERSRRTHDDRRRLQEEMRCGSRGPIPCINRGLAATERARTSRATTNRSRHPHLGHRHSTLLHPIPNSTPAAMPPHRRSSSEWESLVESRPFHPDN